MSVHSVLFMGVLPLGVLILGTVGTFVGVTTTLTVSGVLLAAVTLVVAVRVPAVRRATSQPRHRRQGAQVHPRVPHAEVRNGSAAD
jgi:hypothetical protein